MRWEMAFASRVLSGGKVHGSFREFQDPNQETEDRPDGESAALLRQCVCSEASPTQTRRTASPVGPILGNPCRLKLKVLHAGFPPGHPRREWEVSFRKNPFTSRAKRGIRKKELQC